MTGSWLQPPRSRAKGEASVRLRVCEWNPGNFVSERDKSLGPVHFSGAYDVIAIACSAGGLSALRRILKDLPANFPAAIVIVQHLDPAHRSMLAGILARYTPLWVKQAEENDLLAPGRVYIAPPDCHLLVNADGSLALTKTALVHFSRPSADLLFESVAANYAGRAIGVVLTGAGSDGTTGSRAIQKMGGVVIAQDEASSEFAAMPLAAIRTGIVNMILPLDQIAARLVQLVGKDRQEVAQDATARDA